MRAANFDINVIIDDLRGTCKSIDESVESNYPGMEYSDLTTEDFEKVDSEIFECTQCNWWCDQDECKEDESGQWVCEGCKGEED